MKVKIFAPAKINLTLHVVGQRGDGYHLLDSLVVFADVGDTVTLTTDAHKGLTVTGPEAAGVPTDNSNLVARIAEHFWPDAPLGLALEKNLPPASGLGGGSADAAACFRGIMRLIHTGSHDFFAPSPLAVQALTALGADIPMCVSSRSARATGIGEHLQAVASLPVLPAVLVNPRVPLSTPDVFKALQRRDNAPMPETLPGFANARGAAEWLSGQRNDLQSAAMKLAPVLDQVLRVLDRADGSLMPRMTGSGATCFALFETIEQAQAAADSIAQDNPGWWVKATELGDQQEAAEPRQARDP